MKDIFKYIDILLILSLLVIIVSLSTTEKFYDISGTDISGTDISGADTSGNRGVIRDTSGNRAIPRDTSGNKVLSNGQAISGAKSPDWKAPKPDEEYFWYTTLFISLIIVAIISLSLFVYTYIKNKPSFLYATIGLSCIIIFLLVYLSKYE